MIVLLLYEHPIQLIRLSLQRWSQFVLLFVMHQFVFILFSYKMSLLYSISIVQLLVENRTIKVKLANNCGFPHPIRVVITIILFFSVRFRSTASRISSHRALVLYLFGFQRSNLDRRSDVCAELLLVVCFDCGCRFWFVWYSRLVYALGLFPRLQSQGVNEW